jgi:hypothetical protein
MEFNWDNQHLHAMLSPPYACGQWLINCLSHSKHLCPCAPTQSVERFISPDGMDALDKHELMLSHLPNKQKHDGWHYSSEFYDSIRWLHHHEGSGFNMEDGEEPGELLFQKVNAGMRDYIGQFWRQHAILVSNSNMGLMMKFHYSAEAAGFLALAPQAKIFSITNYESWQRIFIKKSKSALPTVNHWKAKRDYETQGFVFDIDLMIRDESAFLAAMHQAYRYINLDDYDQVMPLLKQYRSAYLRANLEYTK